MSTTRPRCWRSTSSSRCSARARWCAGRCGRARPPRALLALHWQTERRYPAPADLEFGRHFVARLARALPAAAHVHGLAAVHIRRRGKHQRLPVRAHRAADEAPAALDVEILELPGGGVPQVERLPELIR